MENHHQQQKNSHIPHDLIERILLRLPLKSIVRSRSLSKQYLSLTSDTNFINTNFNLSISQPSNFLLYFSDHKISGCSDARWVNVDTSIHHFHKVRLPVPHHYNLAVINSCRGFILVENYGFDPHLILWNPLTGSTKTVSFSYPPASASSHDLIGFGYDESNHDYLVVLGKITRKRVGDVKVRKVQWEFFSVRNNSWEITAINSDHLRFPFRRECGIFFNGAIHWLGTNNFGFQIVAVNLAKKNLHEMLLPSLRGISFTIDLTVFEGYLSLYSMKGNKLRIWVMKEYNVHSSWTKRFTMIHDGFIQPMCFNKCGEIVIMEDQKSLAKFDGNGRLEKCQQGDDFRRGDDNDDDNVKRIRREVMFTPTLLSLPCASSNDDK